LSNHALSLLPAGLVVDQVLPAADRITIMATPQQAGSSCPTCATFSPHVHSRYRRMLADLPWQGRPVTLQLQARRFRCLDQACPRRTFTERLSDVARPAARRTDRLGGLQRQIGLALGGEAGRRLSERLAMPTSADTLLRLICRDACVSGADPRPTPRVLAVDDWAWRRGHRYGTVMVDLERNTVVDLLADRQAASLAEWLRQHPGVEIVARDRAGGYADGVRQGAPDAIQVADRWHLLRNLGDAVRAVVDRQHAVIRRICRQLRDQNDAPFVESPVSAPDSSKPAAAERRRQASYARRQARYEEAARLHAAGVSIKRIADLLGAERKTIRRWLRAGGAPLWRKPPRAGVLTPYSDYLERRWAEGCHNAALLWRDLVQHGFTGRPSTVRQWAGRRRAGERQGVVNGMDLPIPLREPPGSQQMARMLMSETDALPRPEKALVSVLLAQTPGLAAAITAAKRLHRLLRRESQERLDDVLDAAAATPLASFAASIRRDQAAVQAALDLPWTTSPAEGHINRLKTLKRSMYGRAGFQLLRARVLQAA
jgi:transposase